MKLTGPLFYLACSFLTFACAGSSPEPAYAEAANARAAIEQANAAPPAPAQDIAPPLLSAPCAETSKQKDTAAASPSAVSDAARAEGSPTASGAPALGGPVIERAASSPRNHRGKVKELFDLMDMQKIIDATLQDTISAQVKANPALAQFKDIMLEFLAKHMSWGSLERGFVDDYMETFSQAEIEDMIAFYKTPTGAKAIATMPALMKRGSRRGLESVEKHMPELQRTLQERAKSP